MFQQAQALFAKLSPSKRKKSRTKRNLLDELEATSFNESDKQFLMEMVRTLGTHIEQTNAPVKQAVEELHKELKEEIAALKAGVTSPDVEKLAGLVAEKLALSSPPGLSATQSSETSTTAAASTAAGDPLCWVMGALGNDLNREQAQDNARQVLMAAGIEQTRILDIYAPYAFFSICHIVTDSVSTALQAQRSIRNFKKIMGYQNPDGVQVSVRFDRKRSKEERLPYITLMAMFRLVKQDLVTTEVQAAGYVKCGASRHLYYLTRAQVLCHFDRSNQLVWGAWAQSTFDQALLDSTAAKLRSLVK